MGYIAKTTDMSEEEYQQKKREWIQEYEAHCMRNREYQKEYQRLRKEYKKLNVKIPFAEWRKSIVSPVCLSV
jgi:hypothetical protein